MKISAVGMPWYHESDYKRLLEMFEDGERLPRTYREWLQAASSGFEHFEASGTVVEKVYITPKEFAAWCAARGKRLNAEGRMGYANESVARKYLNKTKSGMPDPEGQ